jgi:hypothetical protein
MISRVYVLHIVIILVLVVVVAVIVTGQKQGSDTLPIPYQLHRGYLALPVNQRHIMESIIN